MPSAKLEQTAENEFAQRTSETYDRVAEVYDDLWSPRVREVNARLTAALEIQKGERLADLACGTGTETQEMTRLLGSGEVVAVDYSPKMLEVARLRLKDEAARVRVVHARIEEFVASAPAHAFDVVSLRFALAYIDWREVLPQMGRMLRPGGRLGLLTSLSGSVPQLQGLLKRFTDSPFDALKLLYRDWRLYRHWRELNRLGGRVASVGFVTMPNSASELVERLEAGGFPSRGIAPWTETLRLYFGSGREAIHWARRSGYSTHPVLDGATPGAIDVIEALFAEGLETYRDSRGVPLDLEISGVVARRD